MSSVENNTLPEGWERKKLNEYLSIQNGFAFNSKKFNDNGKGTPLIRIRNLKKSNITTYYDGDFDGKFIITKGDFLIGMDGEFRCYEWNNEKALLNQRVCKITDVNENLDSRFLFYGINKFLKDIEEVTAFVTVKHISARQIKDINFPIPPLEEQKRIVAKIDTLFTKIDKAISLTEKSLVQANNLLPRIIDETFDSFDAEKVDLKSVSDSIQYGYTGKTIENGKYYYLRITDIQGGTVNYQSTPYSDIAGANIEKYKLNKGDILFARTGATAGKSYLFNDEVEAVFASYLIRVVCNQDIVKPSFVKWFFLSANYWKQIFGNIIGAAQPNFNGKKLGELNLKIPSLKQQELVIDYLEKVFIQTKQTKSKLEKQLAYLKRLKSSILSKAFKGELL